MGKCVWNISILWTDAAVKHEVCGLNISSNSFSAELQQQDTEYMILLDSEEYDEAKTLCLYTVAASLFTPG